MVEATLGAKKSQSLRAHFRQWILEIRQVVIVGRLQHTSSSAANQPNQSVGPGGTITGSSLPFQPAQPQPSYGGYGAPEEEETEPIR